MAKKILLGYKEIEDRLQSLKRTSLWADDIGYQLLYAFGKSEKDIQRYREGKGVLKTFDGLLIKGLFCYRGTTATRLTEELERLKRDVQVLKAAPKIVAVSDGKTLLAYDLREKDTYENTLDRLYCDFAFFYPLMDVERVHYVEESPADVKAAEKLAKLHDELRAYNEFRSDSDLHDLNIFITRLLFCFFAEDTGIFEGNLFTDSIQRFTKPDGSDLSQYLDESFNVMDLSLRPMTIPSIVKQFPYVNGGLFSKHIQIPKMGQKARRIIIECGELDWKDINPDIFGSMIQAVVNPEERANQGMHYTSVPNIMKVINPLFMDELRKNYNELNELYESKRQMRDVGALTTKQFYEECKQIKKRGDALLKRMSRMKFFDPACGSGNFLIITYKCLRFLEMDILSLQRKCTPEGEILFVDNSVIRLNQFYGIELLDFPHEVAMLSLWLAEHQMNVKFKENFRASIHALPLKNITQIVCGNACRIDWNEVCPHTKDEEVFVFGNPPYLGSKLQSGDQKKDIEIVFKGVKNCKILDYICNWFMLGANYIKGSKSKYAFVTTNSICQGEQVGVLWPEIYRCDLNIFFAHKSFKWANNAKYNAAVTCAIVGVCDKKEKTKKLIFDETSSAEVSLINPYLMSNSETIVYKRTTDPDGLPKLCFGCMPYDDRNNKYLRLEEFQRKQLLEEYPEAEELIRKIYGSEEFINGKNVYCLWIDDSQLALANSIPPIKRRIDANKYFRLHESVDGQTLAERPHQFREHPEDKEKILIPRVSSENREYIPMGYLNEKDIVSDSAFALYDAPTWLFGILTSALHMVWVKTVGGRLKTDYRYSAQLCYNTFPFPQISNEKKDEIKQAAEEVLVTREFYPEKTLAELYDPDKMPQDLREAHARLDDIVESCYPGYPFANDEARLECLFKLYEKMTKK
ncbi:MAG: class I SAM-dependent DNA methyltransferase [Prevotella sp.]|nr:class I SAM-dependent DNA methyltransferase [Prevotella sp.]